MTKTLAILGDSLMDSGNLDRVAKVVGQDPFEENLYDKGGNRKASDGLVLGEHIAKQLGASVKSNQLVNFASIPGILLTGFDSQQLRTYAYAGARSSSSGSTRSGLSNFPIGLIAQAKAFANTTSREKDLDVLVAAGSNDIIDLVADHQRLLPVLSSATGRDDRRLAKAVAGKIVDNIDSAVDRITGRVDETVIVGLSPLSVTPYVQDQAEEFAEFERDALIGLVDGIAARVNQGLEKRFGSDNKVLVLDGFKVWNGVNNPTFLDDVHPTSKTSQSLAEVITGMIEDSGLRTFGF